jgi:hypothetical protein
MTGKEVVKSVALNTPLGRTIKNLLDDANHMKTALKIKHLGEAMDEKEISFHKQTVQNLIIETDLEGIESKNKLQRHQTTSEHAEGDQNEETRADRVYRRLLLNLSAILNLKFILY